MPASEVGRFRGGTGFPLSYQGWQEGEFPFYKVSDMNNEGNDIFMVASNNWISEEARRKLGAHAFPAGSIVFAKVGAAVFLERKKILSRSSCLDNNMAAFVLDEEQAIGSFIHSQLLAKRLGDLVATTALPSLSGKVLGDMVLAVPPLPEQSAIANALGDVDALLAAQDALIAKKRAIKQGAMQELLTGKRRLPGFSEEWKVKPLGQLCSLKSGEGITAENIDPNSEYPCFGGNGLRGYTKTYTHDGNYALIGRQGALCGNVVTACGKFFASEHALVVAPTESTDIHWLACVLADANLNQHSESSAQPGLSATKLLILEFNAPTTKEEQAAIAEVLSDMDAEITALETHRAKTSQLKQGMMQALLTGRIRLV